MCVEIERVVRQKKKRLTYILWVLITFARDVIFKSWSGLACITLKKLGVLWFWRL